MFRHLQHILKYMNFCALAKKKIIASRAVGNGLASKNSYNGKNIIFFFFTSKCVLIFEPHLLCVKQILLVFQSVVYILSKWINGEKSTCCTKTGREVCLHYISAIWGFLCNCKDINTVRMYDRGHVKEKQRDSQKFVYCRLILSSQKDILLRSCNGHINLIIINTITFLLLTAGQLGSQTSTTRKWSVRFESFQLFRTEEGKKWKRLTK